MKLWLFSGVLVFVSVLSLATVPAAERTLHLPEVPYQYADVDLPSHFKQPAAEQFDNTPADNPVTDAGATLGRVLFYDTRLSANNTVSCGSCHVQAHAFVDPSRFSKGVNGGLTNRHAMNLVNLRYHPRARFFWDERGGNLEAMVLLPVENPLEMGMDLAKLPGILAAEPRYAALFRQAFGGPEITNEGIARALAQFLRSMVSYQSRYDAGRLQVRSSQNDFPNYTPEENRGKALFLSHCARCHLPAGVPFSARLAAATRRTRSRADQDAHFVMVAPANTGLDEDTARNDGGVGDITHNPQDVGRFKSPSLRNVEVTGPYMHDGRFPTLDAVIDHYSSGGKNDPNKNVGVQPHDRRGRPLHFTNSEKAALIAFLKTLTDSGFLSDPRFSDPFK
jgi:cytochrome c peroxidase